MSASTTNLRELSPSYLELAKKEKEKTQLLEITTAVAKISDRAGLFNTIFEKIRPLFGFTEFGLFVIDKNRTHYRMWANNLSVSYSEGEDSQSGEGIPIEGNLVIQSCLNDGPPRMYNKEKMLEYASTMPAVAAWIETSKTEEVLTGTLRYRGKVLGCLNAMSKATDGFTEEMIPLYASVCDIIAVAVANIQANEDILKREQDKTALLSLSEALSAVRDKQQLLEALMERAKRLLHFDDLPTIFLVDELQEHYYIYYSSLIEPAFSTELEDWKTKKVPISQDPVAIELLKNNEVKILRLKESKAKWPDHPGVAIASELHLLEALHIPMYNRGRLLGLISFNALKEGTFAKLDPEIVQSTGEIIASAVANILVTEQILEREKEKALLLSLSEQMASIRNRNDLYTAMMSKLKPVVGFDDAVVIIFSKDLTLYKHFLTASPEERRNNPHYDAVVDRWLPVANTPNEYLLTLRSPYVWHIDELLELYPDYPGCLLCKQTNLHHCIGFRMYSGGDFIGLFQLAFGTLEQVQPAKLNLYKSVAEQIGIAVSNILANEEIAERETENLALLSISQQLAAAGTVQEAMKVIFEKLHKICQFDDVVLVLTDQKKEYLQHIGNYEKSIFRKLHNASYKKIMTEKIPVKNTPYEHYFALKTPVQYAVREFLERNYPDYIGLKIIRLFGIEESLYIPLINNNQLFGTLEFHNAKKGGFDVAKTRLYENVANQLTITIANILGKKKIIEREREKSTLLHISEGLAAVKSREDLLGLVSEKIRPLFDYDDMNLFTLREKDTKFQAWYNHISTNKPWDELFSSVQRGIPVNESIIANKLFEDRKPFIVDRNELIRLYKNSDGAAQLKKSAINNLMLGPLKVAGKVIGSFNLLSTRDKIFSASMLEMFQNITDQLAVTVANILANEEIVQLNKQLKLENTYLLEVVGGDYNPDEFVGQSKLMQNVYNNIGIVAKSDTTVLILGETGTGKELVARAIHTLSYRKNKALIKINCAALPANLIESELFGHERGAFTGAIDRRIGKFELANSSTLFLDEIGELPLELQAKLLRALQEKEVERLGSNKIIKTDVRIVAATNRDLSREVREGRFRMDLYYRLNVFPVLLPPLRQRKEDIPLLANHLIQKAARKLGKSIEGVSNKAMQQLATYEWPGNIREMEHVIERAVLLSKGSLLADMFLPDGLQQEVVTDIKEYVIKPYEEQEREYILFVLQKCGWKVHGPAGAAAVLQLPPTTLQSKMLKLGIKKKHFVAAPAKEQ